jgi:hypothetical protein
MKMRNTINIVRLLVKNLFMLKLKQIHHMQNLRRAANLSHHCLCSNNAVFIPQLKKSLCSLYFCH